MAKILSVASRAGLARFIEPVARALLRAGVTPNAVTIVGAAGACTAAIGFGSQGHFVVGSVIVTLFALTDMLDGTMARIRGQSGRFGALLDSTMDRLTDGAIFGTVVYWFAAHDQPRPAAAATICLLGGVMVSYVKARAEGLGFECNVGIAERAERLILVGIGGLLHGFGVPYGMEVILWLLAVLSAVTVVQRMYHVHRTERAAAGRAVDGQG